MVGFTPFFALRNISFQIRRHYVAPTELSSFWNGGGEILTGTRLGGPAQGYSKSYFPDMGSGGGAVSGLQISSSSYFRKGGQIMSFGPERKTCVLGPQDQESSDPGYILCFLYLEMENLGFPDLKTG